MSDNLKRKNYENFTNPDNVEGFSFDDGETTVVVGAKLFVDINKNIENIKINLKYLEQDIENKLSEKENEAVKQVND